MSIMFIDPRQEQVRIDKFLGERQQILLATKFKLRQKKKYIGKWRKAKQNIV